MDKADGQIRYFSGKRKWNRPFIPKIKGGSWTFLEGLENLSGTIHVEGNEDWKKKRVPYRITCIKIDDRTGNGRDSKTVNTAKNYKRK